MEILEIERKINLRVRKQMEKTQKEYYLREQMKAIQKSWAIKMSGRPRSRNTVKKSAKQSCRRRSKRRRSKSWSASIKCQPPLLKGS